MSSLVLLAFSLLLSSKSTAQTIGAYYSGFGPTLVELDTTAGNFSCNAYTENGFGSMQSFVLTYKPKNDSSMACAGFYTPTAVYVRFSGTTNFFANESQGALFYQTTNNTLVQQIFKCRYSSGVCSDYGGYLISTNVTVPVRPGTGISASLISTDLGYRVTYEDIRGSVRQLSYSNNTQGIVTYWNDGALINNITSTNGSSLSTSYIKSSDESGAIPAGQQTVFQAVDGRILSFSESNVTAINQFHTWIANTPITNLPNWDPTTANYATVTYNQWLMLFYVDTARRVQWIWSTDGGSNWLVQPAQDTTIWPLADTPNAPIAAATSVNASNYSSSLFYMSNGTYIESVLKDWSFAPYSHVGPRAKSDSIEKIITPSQTGLRHRAVTIGVSTGISVGLLVIVAILACFLSHRKRALSRLTEVEEEVSWKASEGNLYGKPELHGQSTDTIILNHDHESICRHQGDVVRRYELRGMVPVELHNCEAPRPELDHTIHKAELDAKVVYELSTWPEQEEERYSAEDFGEKAVKSIQEL